MSYCSFELDGMLVTHRTLHHRTYQLVVQQNVPFNCSDTAMPCTGSHDIKRAITVGIVGYPNVGKSSVINSLKRSRAVGVSARAGFTTSIQVM